MWRPWIQKTLIGTMEGDKSLPFAVTEETISIKDKSAPQGFAKKR